MNSILVFALTVSLSSIEAVKNFKNNGRSIASTKSETDMLGGCIIGINGFLRIYKKEEMLSLKQIRNECVRLVGLAGEPEGSVSHHMYGCGLGVGAFGSSLYGKEKFEKMINDGSGLKLIEKACGV